MSKRKSWLNCLLVVVGLVVLAIALVIGLVVYYATLPRQRYSDDDAQTVLETGTQRMQRWLDENRAGAAISSSENYYFSYPNGITYLTDYVEGTYESEGLPHDFIINAVSGEVYLQDEDELLDGAISQYLVEVFGLSADTKFYRADARLMVPFAVEGSTNPGPTGWLRFNDMLPAGVEDIEAWLHDSTARYDVACDVDARPADTYKLSELTFERLLEVRAQAGLSYESLYLSNRSETIDVTYDHYFYEHYAWGKVEPFRLWYRDAYREQELDNKSAVKEVGSGTVDLARDISVSAIEGGYQFATPAGGTDFPFVLYVDDGSPLLDSEVWIWQESGEDDRPWDLIWLRTNNDGWVMTTNELDTYHFREGGTLIAKNASKASAE